MGPGSDIRNLLFRFRPAVAVESARQNVSSWRIASFRCVQQL
jgi:hypothetical protein